jgi:hypothetical protein
MPQQDLPVEQSENILKRNCRALQGIGKTKQAVVLPAKERTQLV